MKKVIVYGTFDYFHYGHYNLLKRAKALGDYLIVGVSSNKLCLKKGKVCTLNIKQRMDIIKNLRFVDKVIIENNFSQKINDIKKYHVQVYVDGLEYKSTFLKSKEYQAIKKQGCNVVFLKRTPGVSSSKIKAKII